jgi:hypothetical protein
MALAANWTRVPLAAWLVGRSLADMVSEALCCAVQGQPGLLTAVASVIGVVAALLKYRSRVYIALEISGMFIWGGYVMAGLVVIGFESVLHPTGSHHGTSPTIFPGSENGRVFSQDRGSRTGKRRHNKSPFPTKAAPTRRNTAAEHGGEERDLIY